MAIKLGIYKPAKGGFGVYIKGLSGQALDYFVEEGKISLSQGESSVSTKSERLAWKKSHMGAKNWIVRFAMLSEQDQLSRVGNKSIWYFDNRGVTVRVQYYRLISNGIVRAVTPRLKQLESMGKLFSDYSIQPTVTRTHTISQSEFDKIKHDLTILPSLPKSRRESAFANKINSFKVPLNSKIK